MATRIVVYSLLAVVIAVGLWMSKINNGSDRSMRCSVLANKKTMGQGLTYDEMQYKREHCDLY